EGGGGTAPFDPAKSFALKPLPARFLIVFAGPGMNFVLAALIFGVVLATVGRPVGPPVVGRVAEGGPAAAGLMTGDVVTRVDGRAITHWEDLDRAVAASHGRALELTVARGSTELTVRVTPRRTIVRDPIFRDPKDAWDLGAGPHLTPQIGSVNPGSPAETAGLRVGDGIVTRAVRYEPYHPLVAIGYGWVRTWDMTVLTAKGLWKIVSRQIDSSNIGGPIQIAAEAGRQAKEGAASLAVFTAIISVN